VWAQTGVCPFDGVEAVLESAVLKQIDLVSMQLTSCMQLFL
jgi:hypothetical protein